MSQSAVRISSLIYINIFNASSKTATYIPELNLLIRRYKDSYNLYLFLNAVSVTSL